MEATSPRDVATVAALGRADSDLELIQAYQKGDARAFDTLYTRHLDYVYNVCLGVLANPDDARDATQETFLRVYRKADKFQARAAFSTWLYRVAVNTCVEQLRRRPKGTEFSLEDENVREIADDGPDVGMALEQAADEAEIRRVVAELPPDYRLVLVLRYFQGLSYEQMVEVLGYNLGQVKVKLHRARRAFARRWEERALTLRQAEGLG